MSGEREVWYVTLHGSLMPWGIFTDEKLIARCFTKERADQIVREHNAYQDAVAALEKARRVASEVAHSKKGICPVCEVFSGYDTVQQVQGDESHEDWCWIGAALQSIKEQGA